MANRSVISVHTKPETSNRLARLAQVTRRSKSFLANEAIERYLSQEEAFVTGIKNGLAQAETGAGHSTPAARAIMEERIFARSKK